MSRYRVLIKDLNDPILLKIVRKHNEDYQTNFTTSEYLSYILNRWFSHKETELSAFKEAAKSTDKNGLTNYDY